MGPGSRCLSLSASVPERDAHTGPVPDAIPYLYFLISISTPLIQSTTHLLVAGYGDRPSFAHSQQSACPMSRLVPRAIAFFSPERDWSGGLAGFASLTLTARYGTTGKCPCLADTVDNFIHIFTSGKLTLSPRVRRCGQVKSINGNSPTSRLRRQIGRSRSRFLSACSPIVPESREARWW